MTCDNEEGCACACKSRGKCLWCAVTLAFIILICAWAFLIRTAVEHKPDVIEIEPPAAAAPAQTEP